MSKNRFQVDLRGLIELLSQHLYSGPSVFVREMLQNGVDAIQARRQLGELRGTIQIELIKPETGPATLVFQDDGVGLTESEIHEFLSTIGQSSKRGTGVERPEDFLGQFGIGLLSCFMVTDEIVVISQSARDPESGPVEWRGNTDGTYAMRKLDRAVPIGTQVYLREKEGAEEFFTAESIVDLTRNYGEFLEPRISITADGIQHPVNTLGHWDANPLHAEEREEILQLGAAKFEQQFLDVVRLASPTGGVEGHAFIMAHPVHAGARQPHRIYLKGMLLSTQGYDLLPEWSFFVRCIVNTTRIRPTASREALYEDDVLDRTRAELGECLRQYLIHLAKDHPQRFQAIIDVHHLALKALALDDDECLELFADWFPFQTTLGVMPLRQFREANPVIRYVASRDQFRQIAQIAASQELAVINAGFVYDVELIERIGETRTDVEVKPLDVEELSETFAELTADEREVSLDLERNADAVLEDFKCVAEVSKFRPASLPALYITNESADFLHSIEQAQESADDLWSGVLDGLKADVTSAYARLHLNYANDIIRQLCKVPDRNVQQRCIETLYIQSLMMGHYPLKEREMKLLNEGLSGLIKTILNLSGAKDDG